jgi:hypothetical protein
MGLKGGQGREIKYQSLQPSLGFVVARVHDFDAEAEEETVEERVGQVPEVVQEDVEIIPPDIRITEASPLIHGLVQPNPSLERSQS